RLQPGFIVASLFSCALASPFVSAASFAFDVTACGQTIEAGETGVLQADLDCPTTSGSIALLMEPRAVFDVNGHTLNGGEHSIFFEGECLIKGPGTVSGSLFGITSET